MVYYEIFSAHSIMLNFHFLFLANTLIQRKHKHSRDVRAQLDGLLSKWKALLQESANQGRGLEEAQDILEFNLQTDKVDAWIRDKVTHFKKLL